MNKEIINQALLKEIRLIQQKILVEKYAQDLLESARFAIEVIRELGSHATNTSEISRMNICLMRLHRAIDQAEGKE